MSLSTSASLTKAMKDDVFQIVSDTEFAIGRAQTSAIAVEE